MNTKLIWVGLLIVAAIAVGAYFFPQVKNVFGNTQSPTGTTYGDSKIAFIAWVPSTNAATSTSILNTDANDRIVNTVDFWCSSLVAVNGAPLVSTGWSFSAATTTTNSQGLQGNTNYILNTTVATTTPEIWSSSSTPGLTGTADYRRWAPNTYMTFNANASSTATCTIGLSYRQT